jgi:hypothetical protein
MVRNKFGINGKKNTELDNLFKYLCKNNLSININKCVSKLDNYNLANTELILHKYESVVELVKIIFRTTQTKQSLHVFVLLLCKDIEMIAKKFGI